jgi:uncharacterized membrane protein
MPAQPIDELEEMGLHTSLPARNTSSASVHPLADQRFYALLTAVVLVGATLRFSTLTQQSFWFDEGATWLIVAHSFGHVISTVPKTESTPWTYYVVLWLWTRIFGLGEAGLRSLSALCGLATIWINGLTGRRLSGNRAGLAAATLTAVSPIMIYYSQEARAYAMLVMLCALSLLLTLRVADRPDHRRLLAWAGVSAVAISVHYYAVFAIAPEIIWLLIRLSRSHGLDLRQAAVLAGPPLIVGLVLLPLLLHQDDGRADFIAQTPLPGRVATLMKEDVVGLQVPLNTGFKAIGLLVIVVALWLIGFRSDARERRALAAPVSVIVGALVLAVAAGLAGFDFVNTRNLLVFWPALAVALAVMIGVRSGRRVGLLAFATLVGVSLASQFMMDASPYYQRDNWRGVASSLGPATRDQRVLVGDTTAAVSLAPFLPRITTMHGSATRAEEVDVFTLNQVNAAISRPPVPRPLTGFRLIQRLVTPSFTVLRYRATGLRRVTRQQLLSVGLQIHRDNETVVVQSS